MSTQRYTPEFKEEAVRQIVDRGYSVSAVSERLGVSARSLYKWVKSVKPDKSEQHASELIQTNSQLLIRGNESDWALWVCFSSLLGVTGSTIGILTARGGRRSRYTMTKTTMVNARPTNQAIRLQSAAIAAIKSFTEP